MINMNYLSGTIINLILKSDLETLSREELTYDEILGFIVIDDSTYQRLFLVNVWTFEVHYEISKLDATNEDLVLSKLTNRDIFDVLIDKVIKKDYPEEKYVYEYNSISEIKRT